MPNITNTSQLNTFSTIRDIILTNTTISNKFSTKDFYEFEPKLKSHTFKGFPYIVINVPSHQDKRELVGNTIRSKSFEITIILVVDYVAREKVTSYVSNIISALESADDTFNDSGYNLVAVDNDTPEEELQDQKTVITTQINLFLEGEVSL